ncbi:shikimate dehydrogenase [Candidatus Poribacteria bacterium]|nr:shikimate dehydrogenase [Candidatus Poribacteria bacterium]MYH83100.1 shikimate dehydrogenase [Candidatus Poribacteria bacterium]MYK95317.1 shikimate dehydrogenase [Candidatus Poribacteria bacterium]
MHMQHLLTGHTRIVGVIGDPVEHSRSPQMHNAAFAKAGLDYVYVPFHVRPNDLAAAIAGFKAINVVGINVTLPHKQAVISHLTSISREAELIGAVNTLTFTDEGIHGDNTDAPGVLRALAENENMSVPVGENVVVLGAGGAARAVVVALALAGVASMTIANRTVERAVALAEEMRQKTGISMQGLGLADAQLPVAVRESMLLINTATVSMDATHPLLISADWLQPNTIVYDIVYTPPVTPLMRAAAARGCETLGGIGMLVHQGAIAFEKWTGIAPCTETMREALSLSTHRKET